MTTTPPTFGRPFVLQRDLDPTGVSGVGTVADGIEFPDDTVVIRWRGEHASTVVWTSLADALHVHGHGGATRIVWATTASNAAHAQRAQQAEELQRIAHDTSNRAEAERDGAYRERAHLLAWLTTHYPAVIAPAPDVDAAGWQLLYITAPTGQLSWHISPRDAGLLAHVERIEPDDPRAQWDGHTTEQKYERIRQLPLHAAPLVELRIPRVADPATDNVLYQIATERLRQNEKWGEQNHPDGTGNLEQQKAADAYRRFCQDAFGAGYGTWSDVLAEEVAEANAERDPAKLRAELIQVAAVAVAWAEAIDRRAAVAAVDADRQ